MRAEGVRENLELVRDRIARAAVRSGRRADEVSLLAVTKTVPAQRVLEAIEAGVDAVGENYVQEAVEKRALAGDGARWHMIGHLQSNKARAAVACFDVFETVDRRKTASALQRQAEQAGKVVEVFLQFNLSGESSKSGASADEALELVEHIATCANLRCRGLMTIPPYFDEPERARASFAALRQLRDRLSACCPAGVALDELSMGMSGDFEVAIEEGATIVRIGTAIFGSRSLLR